MLSERCVHRHGRERERRRAHRGPSSGECDRRNAAGSGQRRPIEFITGSLLKSPRRVGRELRNELAGIHSARRGSYRVLFRIDESERIVTVLRIDHRGDIYRTL